jgi:hypothetical protein
MTTPAPRSPTRSRGSPTPRSSGSSLTGEEFTLIEHYPDQINGAMPPYFARVTFNHADHDESPEDPNALASTLTLIGPAGEQVSYLERIEGDYREPRWTPIEDIDGLVGCHVQTWPPGSYTARAVAGRYGQLQRWLLIQRTRPARQQFIALAEGH